jgi:hypothetical protein
MTPPKILIDLDCMFLIHTENPFFIAEIISDIDANKYNLTNFRYYMPSSNNSSQKTMHDAVLDSLIFLRALMSRT